jgi:DNA-binding transcriptional ArsR family regulator
VTPSPAIDWERVARARTHPIQISVLELLTIDNGRALSPSEMSVELQEELANVSYHVGALADAGLLEAAGTVPRRGAVEHYYRLSEATPNA